MKALLPHQMSRYTGCMYRAGIRNRLGCVMAVCLGLLLTASMADMATAGQPWVKVSDNGRLALWVDPDYGICKIRDQQQQLEWNSWPSFSAPLNDYWVLAYRSAFIVRYVTDDNVMETVFSGARDCIRRFSTPEPGRGCRVTFNFPNLRIGFSAEYSLGADNNLRVNVPFHSIVDPQKRLLDIRFLPYLEALPFQSNGYVVLPDGCGGMMMPNHLMTPYQTARIYGERFTWSSQPVSGTRQWQRILHVNDYRHSRNSFYNLPLFGVVKVDSRGRARGVLGVISQGQFQAELGTQVTPQLLLTVSPRLIIREVAYDMFGRLHASPVFDSLDRTVDYYFLADRDASYVAMARKYRQLLLSPRRAELRLNTGFIAHKIRLTRHSQTRYRLQLFMGVAEHYQDTEKLLCMTSFSQAEKILKDLHQKGIRDLQVVLVGWTKRGLLGDNPRHFPPEPKFGGYGGLKQLLATGKKLGFTIGLRLDNTCAFKNGHGFNRSGTVKDIQGVPMEINTGEKEYLLCPMVARKKFQRDDLWQVEKLKLNGILVFDGFDQGLFNCYDPRHQTGGTGLIKTLLDMVRTVSEQNQVGTAAAFDFLAGDVTAFYDLPAGCSENCDKAIPLTPLIFHGIVPYSFDPINLRRDGSREFLRMIEYGGVPNAFLTAVTVSELKYAKYNPLFSGKYADWRPAVLREYRIYQRDLRGFQTKAIIDHRCLAPEVYATVYDDHSGTIVNYGSDPFVFQGTIVKPQQFVMINPGVFETVF
jgi:hypothetical protein